MTKNKEVVGHQAIDLWSQSATPIPISQYVKEAGGSEKQLVFSETGAGKTTYYLGILEYLEEQGLPKSNLLMDIVFPDRPNGLAKLYGLIPEEYVDNISVFPVTDYEDTVMATATSYRRQMEHYKKTGVYGWTVFELMENYWTFAQDYFCRKAYGTTIAEYFSQMQDIMSKDKAEKKTAYEAFSGPFGGPWPIIKFAHNFNWIDKVKRYPFNVIFTSEMKEEDNQDSVFKSLGYRPAGEKHTQHKVDTILYLSHKGNNFFMKPFKLTGYKRFYGEINITGKNAFGEHKKALKRLRELGYAVSKVDDLEEQAGIKPPKKPEPKKEKQTEKSKEEPAEKPKEEKQEPKGKEEDIFSI